MPTTCSNSYPTDLLNLRELNANTYIYINMNIYIYTYVSFSLSLEARTQAERIQGKIATPVSLDLVCVPCLICYSFSIWLTTLSDVTLT